MERRAIRVIFQIPNGGRATADILDAQRMERHLDGDWRVIAATEWRREMGIFERRTFVGWHELPQEVVDDIIANEEQWREKRRARSEPTKEDDNAGSKA